MTFVIDANTIATWHVQLTDESDIMMGLAKDGDGFQLVWRFRYDAGTPDERKNWYSGRSSDLTREDAIAHARRALKMLIETSGSLDEPFEVLMDATGVKGFMARLESRMDTLAYIPIESAASTAEALAVFETLSRAKPAGRA